MGLIEEYLKRGKRIDEKFLIEIFNWVGYFSLYISFHSR